MKKKRCPQRGPTMNAKRWWREHNYEVRAAKEIVAYGGFGASAKTIYVTSKLLNRVTPVRNVNALMKHIYGEAIETMLVTGNVAFNREYVQGSR
jgi:hypothetical protein